MILTRLSATKNAAKLAVYDDTMINVKNHQQAVIEFRILLKDSSNQ